MTEQEQERLYKNLGERLRKHRKEAPLSQSQLGSKIGMSRSSIVNIEKGRQRPPLHVIWELARALEMDLEDLLPSKEEVETPENVDPDLETKIAKKIGTEEPKEIQRIAEFIQTNSVES